MADGKIKGRPSVLQVDVPRGDCVDVGDYHLDNHVGKRRDRFYRVLAAGSRGYFDIYLNM